jgi:CRP-like cAMP-binding protein
MSKASHYSRYFFNSKSILETLPAKDLALLTGHLRLKKIPKGRTLFEEGSRPRTVFILRRGRVKLFQRNSDGGEQIVYIYSAGEMFGYRPLLSNNLHPAAAMTIEECGIYFLSDRVFLDLLARSAALSNLLLKNLSHEFTVLVNRIATFSQRTAKERIALSLLIVNEAYGKHGGGTGEITLSRADLAAFAGTTGETLARILTRFKSEKIVKASGRKLFILRPDKLKDIIE